MRIWVRNTLWWRASVFGCGKGEIPIKAASRRVLGAPPPFLFERAWFPCRFGATVKARVAGAGATPRPPVSRMCGRWAAAFGIRLT